MGKVIAWAKRWKTTLSLPVIAGGTALVLASPPWVFFPLVFSLIGAVLVWIVWLAVAIDRNSQ